MQPPVPKQFPNNLIKPLQYIYLAPPGSTPNEILGDLILAGQGFQLNSDDILYPAANPPGSGEITLYVLQLTFKINTFGTGDIFIQKADPVYIYIYIYI